MTVVAGGSGEMLVAPLVGILDATRTKLLCAATTRVLFVKSLIMMLMKAKVSQHVRLALPLLRALLSVILEDKVHASFSLFRLPENKHVMGKYIMGLSQFPYLVN